MRAKLEVLALVLSGIGLIGTIVATAVPTWRVTAFIGANLIVMEDRWEGLWMNCFKQIDKMQCKVYDSLLILPAELQAARGLMCVSIVLTFIALFITVCGTKKSNVCNDNMKGKNITLAFAGCMHLLSCLTTLIPVCWVAHTIISNFYNPTLLDAQRHELGSALYVGWATAGILLVTGIILLVSFSHRRAKEEESYEDTYFMAVRDVPRENSVHLERTSSSSHKHHEYV